MVSQRTYPLVFIPNLDLKCKYGYHMKVRCGRPRAACLSFFLFTGKLSFGLVFLSPLQRPRHQPAQEEPPQEDVDQQRRQGRQQRPGHLHVPLHDLAARQVVQRDRHRPGGVLGQHHREQEVVVGQFLPLTRVGG